MECVAYLSRQLEAEITKNYKKNYVFSRCVCVHLGVPSGVHGEDDCLDDPVSEPRPKDEKRTLSTMQNLCVTDFISIFFYHNSNTDSLHGPWHAR